MMRKIFYKYRVFAILLLINIVLLFINPSFAKSSLELSWENFVEMLTVLPPIFILLGLLDVWVQKETMIKYMGVNSGLFGIVIAFVLGSVAAGPLYGAFPLAAVLIKKGCKLTNVFIMLGAWSTTKIPLIMFEAASLGFEFMIIRLLLDLFGIIIIAYIINGLLNENDKKKIIDNNISLN